MHFSSECWYGNTLPEGAQTTTDGCDVHCPGKQGEACGGGNRITLYRNTAWLPPPEFNPGENGYTLVGCYSDSVPARGLQYPWNNYRAMTVAACTGRAAENGYRYAAVEYYGECWMGNVLATTSGSIANELCNTRCAGRQSEICGGSDAMALYEDLSYQVDIGSFVLEGCYTDSVPARGLEYYETSANGMTNELCAQYAKGFKYFGTEWASECFWGNRLADTSVPASSGCNSPCSGDASQTCGGGDRLSLYIDPEYQEPPPPTVHQGTDPWELVGCHTDSSGFPNSHISDTMTVERCFELASSYRYSAVQDGGTCYWGDDLVSSSVDLQDCITPCMGKSSEICGGDQRSVLYQNTAFYVPDIEDLIFATEELTECEEQLVKDLQLYEEMYLEAEAEGNSGALMVKRAIPFAWVGRLLAHYVDMLIRCQQCRKS